MPDPEPTNRDLVNDETEVPGLADSDPGRGPSPSGNGAHAPAAPSPQPAPSPETSPASTPMPASPAKTSGASGTGGESGGTTGGYETMLGKLLVENGLVTTEEIDACNALLTQGEGTEQPRSLEDVLIENDFVTRHQLRRLQRDVEENKSSQQIPGYRILRKLGSGAMAGVFLAKQISLDRMVAIKVLPKKFSDNRNFIERFYKEGRAAAQLNHPNIVQAYDVGQVGDHHYFVMEYVDGHTVYDELVKHKQLDEKQALEIIVQVAKALEHAHSKGFIHRDIKPKNIMISSSGVVKLADLGLARALSDKEAAQAEAGRAYGTPYYISPEQIRGEVNIGPEADIYGLGATFYHMVTGKVPYEGKNPSEVMHKHLKQELEPPDHRNPRLSTSAAQIIEMMMAKSRGERYHTVADLMTDLDRVRKGESPYFAKGAFDMQTVAPAASADHAPAQSPPTPAAGSRSMLDSPTVLVLGALLLISVLFNVVLLMMNLG